MSTSDIVLITLIISMFPWCLFVLIFSHSVENSERKKNQNTAIALGLAENHVNNDGETEFRFLTPEEAISLREHRKKFPTRE